MHILLPTSRSLPCAVLMLLAMTSLSAAETYYVRIDGNDSNTGLADSTDEAWKSLDHAVASMSAGDRLLVGDGTHYTTGLNIKDLQATAEKPTIIASQNPWGAKITRKQDSSADQSVIVVSNTGHLRLVGFEVFDNTTAIESGVDVRDGSHHITVKGCYVHDCGCGGISSRTSDYLNFEHNVVRDNAKRNKWNCSGISIWHPVEHDQEEGFHLVIRRNVVFENECDIPFSPHGFKTPTDGNGIIMDDFYNTQGGGQEGGYQSDVLIENNLSFNNGGRGIHVYKSDNILIRNNTTFHNMRVLSKYGSDPAEINVDESFGTQVINNIMVKNPELKNPALRFWKNDVETTKVMNNVVVGEKNFCGQKLFEKDNIYREADDQSFPNFKNPTVDVEFDSIDDFEAYFSLARRSPAINAATKANAAEVDLTGKKRPRRRVDAGCYER